MFLQGISVFDGSCQTSSHEVGRNGGLALRESRKIQNRRGYVQQADGGVDYFSGFDPARVPDNQGDPQDGVVEVTTVAHIVMLSQAFPMVGGQNQ